ncbi:MAG: hypothetical protein KGL39_32470 [Patescibacteria group bacterium]|nr:hypothetical protein [Patescibacteria group bacterium]
MKAILFVLAFLVAADHVRAAEPVEALKEVNIYRARRGLRPFRYDEGLTRAAKGCAKFRADRLIEGHYRDFAALPRGTTASAAGCAAAHDHWGWLSCCAEDN